MVNFLSLGEGWFLGVFGFFSLLSVHLCLQTDTEDLEKEVSESCGSERQQSVCGWKGVSEC